MQATALAGETLDLLCWRVLGRTADVTEQALELNPGLAGAGPMLAEGAVVTLPDVRSTTLIRETVNLWD